MPVAKIPQESLPNSTGFILDELRIDDVSCLIKSYINIVVSDELTIDTVRTDIGHSIFISVLDELDVADKLCHFKLIDMDVSDDIDAYTWHNYSEQYGDIVQNYVPGTPGEGTVVTLGEIDGGFASSVYTVSQLADGGGALWL